MIRAVHDRQHHLLKVYENDKLRVLVGDVRKVERAAEDLHELYFSHSQVSKVHLWVDEIEEA